MDPFNATDHIADPLWEQENGPQRLSQGQKVTAIVLSVITASATAFAVLATTFSPTAAAVAGGLVGGITFFVVAAAMKKRNTVWVEVHGTTVTRFPVFNRSYWGIPPRAHPTRRGRATHPSVRHSKRTDRQVTPRRSPTPPRFPSTPDGRQVPGTDSVLHAPGQGHPSAPPSSMRQAPGSDSVVHASRPTHPAAPPREGRQVPGSDSVAHASRPTHPSAPPSDGRQLPGSDRVTPGKNGRR